ncbi:unnamed protein product [Arctogadus glacialis]
MRGTQATTLLFSEEQGSVSSFVSGLIETMEILFLLLGFLFFVKGCTGLTLYGEVGGTVVFQCNSTIKDIISIYFQGGPGFTDFIIGYHKTKNLTEPKRLHTKLSLENKTVTFWNLTVSDKGIYKCLIDHGVGRGITEDTITTLILIATPGAVTLERHNPESAGDVSSLTCTAIAVYPVSNISWNVSGVLEHQWKNVVKENKNSLLFNISSTAFFNCSDGSARLIRCSLGGVSSDEKIICEQPEGHTSLLYFLLLIVLVLVCVGGFAWWKKCKRNPLCNQQRPQSDPQADPVSATEEVTERESFVPKPPVAEDLEMETLNNTNSNENM